MTYGDASSPFWNALTGLLLVLTPLLVIVTTILQTWYQGWKQEQAKKELSKKTEEEAAQLAKKVAAANENAAKAAVVGEEVRETLVNGEFAKRFDRIEEWQMQHGKLDDDRHKENLKVINDLTQVVNQQSGSKKPL